MLSDFIVTYIGQKVNLIGMLRKPLMFALKSVSFDEYHLILIIVLLDFMNHSL